MKKFLIFASMLFTISFAKAQCKIYSGKSSYSATQVGFVDGGKIYSGKSTYSATQVGFIDGEKIYSGKSTYSATQVGFSEGCGQSSTGAAALLLIL